MIAYLIVVGLGLALLFFAVMRLSQRHHPGDSGSSSHFSPSDPGPG
jgi:hypothetical protein